MPGDTSYVVVVGADSMKQTETGGGASAGSQDGPWYQRLRDSSRAAGQSGSTAPAGSNGGADGKTLDPGQKELPTGEPNQTPSDPPRTTHIQRLQGLFELRQQAFSADGGHYSTFTGESYCKPVDAAD